MFAAEKGIAKVKKRLSPDEIRIKKLENDIENMKGHIANLDSKVVRISELKWGD